MTNNQARLAITQRQLKKYLNYDPISGHLTWIKKLGNKVVVGNRAGTICKRDGHRYIKIFGWVGAEHRLIWFYVTGEWPKGHIDHEDHDEQNNSWTNLREVTQEENNKNSSLRCDNHLGITGVYLNKNNSRKKYTAEINNKGKRKVKSFLTLDEAIVQRKVWEKEFGFHKNHGIHKPS